MSGAFEERWSKRGGVTVVTPHVLKGGGTLAPASGRYRPGRDDHMLMVQVVLCGC
jgi:hypothetical protein